MVKAARAAGVRVVHGTAHHRGDGLGGNVNARLFAAMRRSSVVVLEGTPAAEIIPEVGVERGDLVLPRLHGLGPMAGTELDPVLRNMGVSTVVVVGVSVNIAVQNLTFDAVNLGYQVVIPRDAVAGVPADYAEAVLENTLSLVATLDHDYRSRPAPGSSLAMDLVWSEADERFRAELRSWLDGALPQLGPEPEREDWGARRGRDTTWQRMLFDAGYAGINWPAEFGGRGASLSEQLVFYEEITNAGRPTSG